MLIRNRYPAHFTRKYLKANQPEMTFLVSGMTKPDTDKGLPRCSDNKKCMFLAVKKIKVIHKVIHKVIKVIQKQFITLVLKLLMKNTGNLFVRLFVISLLTFRYFPTIVPFFGAGPLRFFLRLRLRLQANRFGGSGSDKMCRFRRLRLRNPGPYFFVTPTLARVLWSLAT